MTPGVTPTRSVAPEDFIYALVPGWIVGFINLRTGREQGFYDGDLISPGLVDGRQNRAAKNRSAVHVHQFHRGLSSDEQLDRIQVSAVRSPVKGRQSCACPCGRINTLSQQEIGHAGSTKKTSTRERLSQRLPFVVKIPLLVPLDYAAFVAVKG